MQTWAWTGDQAREALAVVYGELWKLLDGDDGDDVIRGGLGGDLFRLSAGNDRIEDFNFNENDRLGLEFGVNYDLVQLGNDLQVITAFGTTTLWGVDQDQLLAANRITVL